MNKKTEVSAPKLIRSTAPRGYRFDVVKKRMSNTMLARIAGKTPFKRGRRIANKLPINPSRMTAANTSIPAALKKELSAIHQNANSVLERKKFFGLEKYLAYVLCIYLNIKANYTIVQLYVKVLI